MGNYTPNLFMIQPIYDPTRPFATPSQKGLQCCCPCSYKLQSFRSSSLESFYFNKDNLPRALASLSVRQSAHPFLLLNEIVAYQKKKKFLLLLYR